MSDEPEPTPEPEQPEQPEQPAPEADKTPAWHGENPSAEARAKGD